MCRRGRYCREPSQFLLWACKLTKKLQDQIEQSRQGMEFRLSPKSGYAPKSRLDLDSQASHRVVVAPRRTEDRASPIHFSICGDVASIDREESRRFGSSGFTVAESAVEYVPNGIVVAPGFIAIDEDKRILTSSFRAFGHLERSNFSQLDGETFYRTISPVASDALGVIVGGQNSGNYFHWLIEYLSRVWTLADYRHRDDLRFIFPTCTSWMSEMAGACGIRSDQIEVLADDARVYKRLLVPTRGLANIHTFAAQVKPFIQSVRNSLVNADRPSAERARRLFVSRAKSPSRRIVNEQEIVGIAQRYGFELIFPETLSFGEQVSAFAEAEIVAGALGAGLTNAAFMEPGARLLEFAPEGREGDATLFSSMCQTMSLGYAGVVCPTTSNDVRPFDRRDFWVDPAHAELALRQVC